MLPIYRMARRREGLAADRGIGHNAAMRLATCGSKSPGLAAALALALLAAGLGAQAETPPPSERSKPNRLATASSLYLRQHQHNPVDWFPWGDEAFAKAKAEQKPVLVSIGYASCHWCHVMERESYRDAAIARLLNEHYVCIKVDREERPDVDEIYLAALQAMGQDGGWPLHVFLLPDQKPFYGGTYFPPQDAHGRPGFRRVLEHIATSYRERRDEIERGAAALSAHLASVLAPSPVPGEPSAALLTALVERAAERLDAEAGGFGEPPAFAPKFPPSVELALLQQLADPRAQAIVARTLQAMRDGGLQDQLAGGFHRYSTDRFWRVPHFEKMLYDNAQLAQRWLTQFERSGEPADAEVARRTLDYLLREMQGPQGGFVASQDADSEPHEGAHFVWSAAEFAAVLGDEASLAAQYFGVTAAGNLDGRNVLRVALPIAELAAAVRQPPAQVAQRLQAARERLWAARLQRPRPVTDAKVITAWHALAISACVHGYRVLGDARYREAALRAGEFARTQLLRDGRCRRSWDQGEPGGPGVLEDQALLAQSMLDLFEQEAELVWLQAARALLQQMIAQFGAEDGGFYSTAADQQGLLLRSKSLVDGPLPSGAGVAAQVLLRAGLWLADSELAARGRAVLRANHALCVEAPLAMTSMLLALQFDLSDPREVVIAGDPAATATQALVQAARQRFGSSALLVAATPERLQALAAASPVFADKGMRDGLPTAYVCRRGVCAAPITDPAGLRELR